MQLPEWFTIPVECFYCNRKTVKTFEELTHVAGFSCACGKFTGINNPLIQERIKQGEVMLENLVKPAMTDWVSGFLGTKD